MTTDARAEKLADLVLDYSVSLTDQDKLLIQFDPVFTHYATLIGNKALERGAQIKYDPNSNDPVFFRRMLERNNKDEWRAELQRRSEVSQWCTARVWVDCDSNSNYSDGIPDGQKLSAQFNLDVRSPSRAIIYRKGPNGGYEVKSNIVGFPYEKAAKRANMTLAEYSDFVYAATLGNDWREMGKKMEHIKSAFDNANDVHIYVPGLTDLHLSLKGRGAQICEGKHNMPDGEIFYGPIEDSLEGYVTFQCPSNTEGSGIIEGIYLQFEKGLVTDFSAKKNETALMHMLDTDAGSKRIGELGIGCNYGITRSITDTLFDEKIGGTIHLALGESFENHPLTAGGGLNKSAIHWDLVCDLRKQENDAYHPGGQITVDGKIVQQNGKWLI